MAASNVSEDGSAFFGGAPPITTAIWGSTITAFDTEVLSRYTRGPPRGASGGYGEAAGGALAASASALLVAQDRERLAARSGARPSAPPLEDYELARQRELVVVRARACVCACEGGPDTWPLVVSAVALD